MRRVRLYRWRGKRFQHGNFGDEITIPILDRIFGVEALPVGLEDAELLGAGSILEFYVWKIGRPPAWKRFLWPSDLHVWGTGTLFDQHEIGWPQRLHFHAVRGSLTAERVGVSGITLGDPGILSSRLIRRPKKESAVAAIPHFLDKRRLADLPRHWRVVDPDRPVDDVLTQIASAELVLSSSLHGLIAADSFGIPCVWIAFLGGQPDSPTHKFLDYASARGRDFNGPITWAEAVVMPTDTLASKATIIGRDVEAWQEELISAFPM
jgi:pyruvyltransferase